MHFKLRKRDILSFMLLLIISFLNLDLSLFIIILLNYLAPYMRKKIEYSYYINCLIYNAPFFIASLYSKNVFVKYRADAVIVICILIFIMMACVFIELKENNKYFNSIVSKITLKYASFQILFIIIGVICEELYFRKYLIAKVYYMSFDLSIYYSIILSSILFVYIHFINLWAKKMYSKRTYLYQFILSVLLGLIFCYTRNIYLCIIIHFLYDYSLWYPIIKNISIKNNSNSIFNDY